MSEAMRRVLARLQALQDDHLALLANLDTPKSRVVTVASLKQQLSGISTRQQEMLDSAIECARIGQHRPAIVMAWAALADFIIELLGSDGFAKLNHARPKWHIASAEQLQEGYTEFAIVEATEAAGFIRRTRMKTMHGLLNTRNRAAHPGAFSPGLNQTLGYLEQVLDEFMDLQ